MKGDMISGVIIVVIVIMSSILVLNTINPFVEESKEFQRFNEAKQVLHAIDSVIQQMIYEAPGTRRTIDVDVRNSKLQVVGSEDKIKIRVEDVELLSSGVRTEEGNIAITSGALMRAYESDIDGDGSTDLVMENGAVVFAMKKLGSPASHVVVNTTSIVTLMRNKNFTINVSYPRTGIYINDREGTSYGAGYTELTRQGDNLASSGIHLFVNSTSTNVTYDMVFLLAASQDFIGVAATKVTGA